MRRKVSGARAGSCCRLVVGGKKGKESVRILSGIIVAGEENDSTINPCLSHPGRRLGGWVPLVYMVELGELAGLDNSGGDETWSVEFLCWSALFTSVLTNNRGG